MHRLWIILFLWLTSCGFQGNHASEYTSVSDNNIQRDTIFLTRIDTLPVHDTVYICTENVDSLKDELFLSKYRIGQIKYYVSIVDRNPSQLKFLKGWINRAVK